MKLCEDAIKDLVSPPQSLPINSRVRACVYKESKEGVASKSPPVPLDLKQYRGACATHLPCTSLIPQAAFSHPPCICPRVFVI